MANGTGLGYPRLAPGGAAGGGLGGRGSVPWGDGQVRPALTGARTQLCSLCPSNLCARPPPPLRIQRPPLSGTTGSAWRWGEWMGFVSDGPLAPPLPPSSARSLRAASTHPLSNLPPPLMPLPQVSDTFFWAGPPWEMVARHLIADALTAARLRPEPYTQADVIAVRAAGVGWGHANGSGVGWDGVRRGQAQSHAAPPHACVRLPRGAPIPPLQVSAMEGVGVTGAQAAAAPTCARAAVPHPSSRPPAICWAPATHHPAAPPPPAPTLPAAPIPAPQPRLSATPSSPAAAPCPTPWCAACPMFCSTLSCGSRPPAGLVTAASKVGAHRGTLRGGAQGRPRRLQRQPLRCRAPSAAGAHTILCCRSAWPWPALRRTAGPARWLPGEALPEDFVTGYRFVSQPGQGGLLGTARRAQDWGCASPRRSEQAPARAHWPCGPADLGPPPAPRRQAIASTSVAVLATLRGRCLAAGRAPAECAFELRQQ
jgi:hypothetical protein